MTKTRPTSNLRRLLTRSADKAQDPELRRRARLLSAVLVVLMPSTLIAVALARLAMPDGEEATLLVTGGLLGVVLLFTAWRLTDTRHFNLAAVIALVTMTALPFASLVARAFTNPDTIATSLAWTLLPILLASLLLSVRGTVIFVAVTLAALASLPALVPRLTFEALSDPLGLITSLSALVLVAAALTGEDRRRIQAQNDLLADGERRYRNLFDGVSVGLCVHDGARILDVNRSFERLFGHPLAEARALSVPALVTDADRPALSAHLDHPDDDTLVGATLTGRRADGTTVPLELVGDQRVPGAGAVRVLELRDATPLHEAQAAQARARLEAEAATAAQSRFLAFVSRALRPPIQAASGIVQTLQVNRAGNLRDEDLTFLRRLGETHEALLRQVGDVLMLSQLESGRIQLALGTTFVDRLVRETIDEHRRHLRGRDVTLHVHVPPMVAPVDADSARLKQLVKHLVGHALRATRQGEVAVELVVDPETSRPVRLSVHDADTTTTPEALERLLAPAGDLATGAAPDDLGLAMCRALAELMGARLEAVSEPGRGASYLLHLDAPLSRGPSRDDRDPRATPAPDVPPLADRRVLVVDAAGGAPWTDALAQLGAEVAATADPSAALRDPAAAPDLVVATFDPAAPRPLQLLDALARAPREVPLMVVAAAGEDRAALLGRLALGPLPLDPLRVTDRVRRLLGDGRHRVLVVAPDEDETMPLFERLQSFGHEVRVASSGQRALDLLRTSTYDGFVVHAALRLDDSLRLLELLCSDRRYLGRPLLLLGAPADHDSLARRLGLLTQALARPAPRVAADLARASAQVLSPEPAAAAPEAVPVDA